MFATLLGCGLRRSELTNLTMKHVQTRDNRWCIVDLVGKHGRVRTIPMPTRTKNAIDAWTSDVGVTEGHLFRPVNRGDQVCGDRMSEKVVWQMLKTYVAGAGLPGHRAARPPSNNGKALPGCGWGTGTDSITPWTFIGADDGAVSRDEAGPRARPQ
jgi:integrase